LSWWSEAVYCLKITSEQFWRLTPAQFFALEKQYLRDVRMCDYRSAVTACILANIYREKGAKVREPKDFFPSLNTKKKAMSMEQMKRHMSMLSKKVKAKPNG